MLGFTVSRNHLSNGYSRGFVVQRDDVASYPWIPNWYAKWLYPWAICKAMKAVKKHG